MRELRLAGRVSLFMIFKFFSLFFLQNRQPPGQQEREEKKQLYNVLASVI